MGRSDAPVNSCLWFCLGHCDMDLQILSTGIAASFCSLVVVNLTGAWKGNNGFPKNVLILVIPDNEGYALEFYCPWHCSLGSFSFLGFIIAFLYTTDWVYYICTVKVANKHQWALTFIEIMPFILRGHLYCKTTTAGMPISHDWLRGFWMRCPCSSDASTDEK